eukprot:7389898-Ditylum_brightwellii.AAC.1
MEEELLMMCHKCQPDLTSSMDTAYSATITGPFCPLGPANDLTSWLIDSGSTSHFIPHPEDLYDMESYQIEVTVADGSTVMTTHT